MTFFCAMHTFVCSRNTDAIHDRSRTAKFTDTRDVDETFRTTVDAGIKFKSVVKVFSWTGFLKTKLDAKGELALFTGGVVWNTRAHGICSPD